MFYNVLTIRNGQLKSPEWDLNCLLERLGETVDQWVGASDKTGSCFSSSSSNQPYLSTTKKPFHLTEKRPTYLPTYLPPFKG